MGEEIRHDVHDWDVITLSGLKTVANHGVYDFERAGSQDFIADIALYVDARKAARTDDVAYTVDYSAVAEDAVAILTGPAVFLIETLASRLAEMALSYPGVKRAVVTVHKPMAPLKQQLSDVSVTVVRERKGQTKKAAHARVEERTASEVQTAATPVPADAPAEVTAPSRVESAPKVTVVETSTPTPPSPSPAEAPPELAVTQLDAPKPPSPIEKRREEAGRRANRKPLTYADPTRPADIVYDVVLALGANRGDTLATLRGAVEALAGLDGFEVEAVSPLVRTEPVLEKGALPQDDYLNAVVIGRTVLAPPALLAATQKIEADFGRVRVSRWGARTLDIDIIALDQMRLQTRTLTLPHPRAKSRAFVLYPWSKIAPNARLAGAGYVKDLLEDATDRGGLLMEYPNWLEGDENGGLGEALPLELAPRATPVAEPKPVKRHVENAVIRGQQVELLDVEGDPLFRALMKSESGPAPVERTKVAPAAPPAGNRVRTRAAARAKQAHPLPSRRSLHGSKQGAVTVSDAPMPAPVEPAAPPAPVVPAAHVEPPALAETPTATQPHEDQPEVKHPSGTIPVVTRSVPKVVAPTEQRKRPRHKPVSQPESESLPEWDFSSHPQTRRVVDAVDAPDPSQAITSQIPRVSRHITVRPTPTGSIPVRKIPNVMTQS